MIVFLLGLEVVWFLVLAVFFSYIIYAMLKDSTEIIEFVSYDGNQRIFLQLINEHRKSIGLNELIPSAKLDFNANQTVEKFPPLQHYNSLEIVGGGHQTLTALFRHYLNSVQHRNLIEYENFLYIGIGIRKIENKYYNVTLFN